MTDEDDFDPDIKALSLGWGDKAGLQLYRNYTRAFEEHAVNRLRATLNAEPMDLDRLTRVVQLIADEDLRFVPVIACGFADEILKSTLRAAVPSDIPGGASDLFKGFGPLSDLSKRIKMAFAFDVLSKDLLLGVDAVRSIRNRIAHDWDLARAIHLFEKERLTGLFAVEEDLHQLGQLPAELPADMWFRIRVAWNIGRLTYEEATYQRVKQAKLSPDRVLYEGDATVWLRRIAQICLDGTYKIRDRAGSR